MFTMQRATALLLLAAAAVDAHSIEARDDCKEVHIFLAKGNNEPYPGRQGKLAEAICDGLKSCDYEDIKMQNMLPDPFCDSVTEGVQNGIKQITAYNKRCPDSKLVVSGYSQGAQVVGDILGGGGGVFFQGCVEPDLKGLSPKSKPGNSIYAAMVFGDTRHTQNQPFNVLSGADKNGLFPRPPDQLSNLVAYGDVFRSYCVKTDPICAAGKEGKDVQTHLNYFDVYTDDVAEWVQEKVDAEEGTTTTTAKTSTKTKASTTSTEDATTTSEASETETGTKTETEASTTKNTAASATDDASSAAKTETSEGKATSDPAAPSSTDSAATSKSASLLGMVMGIAALLAI